MKTLSADDTLYVNKCLGLGATGMELSATSGTPTLTIDSNDGSSTWSVGTRKTTINATTDQNNYVGFPTGVVVDLKHADGTGGNKTKTCYNCIDDGGNIGITFSSYELWIGAFSHDWNDPNNWYGDPSVVPSGANGTAILNTTGSVVLTSDVSLGALDTEEPTVSSTLDLNGHMLNIMQSADLTRMSHLHSPWRDLAVLEPYVYHSRLLQ